MQTSLLFSTATPSEIVTILEDHDAALAKSIEDGPTWGYPSAATPLIVFALRSDVSDSRDLCIETIQEFRLDLADPVRTWIPFEEQLGSLPSVFLVITALHATPDAVAALRRFITVLLTAHNGIVNYEGQICSTADIRARGEGALPVLGE